MRPSSLELTLKTTTKYLCRLNSPFELANSHTHAPVQRDVAACAHGYEMCFCAFPSPPWGGLVGPMARLSHPATSPAEARAALPRRVLASARLVVLGTSDPATPTRGMRDGTEERKGKERKKKTKNQGLERSLQRGTSKAQCTYPGPSVVMMGFKPSFFLFLFIVELPLADAAGAVAPCAGCCAGASLLCTAPVIVRKEGNRQSGSQNGVG